MATNARSEKRRAYEREYRKANKEKLKTYSQQHYQDNKQKYKTKARRAALKTYGITNAEYQRMETQQGARCAICSGTEPGGTGRWAIDHNHSTGRVRGLLCNTCNRGLGFFKDNAALLAQAAKYLKQND